ncbi:hypothetical protein BDR26DRAFT_160575 [Obelidium mucronatum]|nr:hypothetical protein BDR26DRAFT_160575 [Obelidium mucronatum]
MDPSDDPFFAVRDDIEQQFQECGGLAANLRRGVGGSERQWTAARLAELLAQIGADVDDLGAAVAAAAASPARFGVDAKEVGARRAAVADARRRLADLQALLAKPHDAARHEAAHAKEAALARDAKAAQQPPVKKKDAEALPKNNDRFIDREGGLQQTIMKEQDEQLEGVLGTVQNMKEIAIVMNQEIDDQTGLLQDLDVQVDMTQGKLDVGMKRLKDFIDANADTKQQWTICCLIIALVVLLVIVFSM